MTVENDDAYIINFLVFGLSIILFLNFWWASIMTKIGYTALKSGKGAEDTQHTLQEKSKVKNSSIGNWWPVL